MEKLRTQICPHCGKPNCQGFLKSISEASNRSMRRGLISQQKQAPQAIRSFRQAQREYNEAINARNAAVVGKNLSALLYKGEVVHPRWVDAARAYSINLERAESFIKPDEKPKLLSSNLYGLKIKGTSLRDVEQMPLPLLSSDITKILKMVSTGPFDRFFLGRNAQLVQEMMVTLPAADLARPAEVTIPEGIRPLHARLTNFFDYYTGFLQQPFLDDDEYNHFFWAMARGYSRFYQGLGLFVPARLGITPSSTTKLLAEKLLYVPIFGKKAIKGLSLFLKDSYRKDGLPANFVELQDYTPLRDKDFSTALLRIDQETPIASLGGGVEEAQGVFGDFRKFQALIRADVLRVKDKQLQIPSSNPSIAEIRVSTQYRRSLAFLVRLATGESVLLEVNGINRLFGIPAELFKEDPNINDKLTKAILEPFIDFSRQLHPEKGQRPVISVSSDRTPVVKIPKIDGGVVEIEAKPPKRKRLLSASGSQALPSPAKTRRQVYRVDYNRTAVAKLLKLPYEDKLVDRSMRAIKSFEWGERQAEHIHKAPGHIRIKVGHRRIALELLGGTNYTLRAIDKRAEIYSKKGLSGLKQ